MAYVNKKSGVESSAYLPETEKKAHESRDEGHNFDGKVESPVANQVRGQKDDERHMHQNGPGGDQSSMRAPKIGVRKPDGRDSK